MSQTNRNLHCCAANVFTSFSPFVIARASLITDQRMSGVPMEETDFGQSRFGHPDLANLGQSNFGQSIYGHLGFCPANFGQNQFWPIQFGPIQFWFHGSGVCVGGAKGWGPEVTRTGLGPKGEEGPKPRKKSGPEGWEAQNFALFSLSRHHFALLVSLWVSYRGILVVFEASGPSNVHVWSSRVDV